MLPWHPRARHRLQHEICGCREPGGFQGRQWGWAQLWGGALLTVGGGEHWGHGTFYTVTCVPSERLPSEQRTGGSGRGAEEQAGAVGMRARSA